jgi:diacylglycerol kinase
MSEAKEFHHRNWVEKFGRAFRGIAWGIRGRSRFIDKGFLLHLLATAAVCSVAWALKLSALEWCMLVLCIAVVLTAELLNAAIESLSRAVTGQYNQFVEKSLDIAAGAVLLASILSVVVAAILFLPKLIY